MTFSHLSVVSMLPSGVFSLSLSLSLSLALSLSLGLHLFPGRWCLELI